MGNKKFNINSDNPDLDWSPLSIYNYPFKIKKLRIQNKNFLFFSPTIFAFVIPLLFFLLFWSIFPKASKNLDITDIGIISVASIFIIIGFWFLYKDLKPIIFSKTSTLFWRGYKKPYKSDTPNYCKLEDIEAVQVLWKEINYQFYQGFAYELNLILKNNKRIHLFSVSDPSPLLKEAETLANFLNVPLYYRI